MAETVQVDPSQLLERLGGFRGVMDGGLPAFLPGIWVDAAYALAAVLLTLGAARRVRTGHCPAAEPRAR